MDANPTATLSNLIKEEQPAREAFFFKTRTSKVVQNGKAIRVTDLDRP